VRNKKEVNHEKNKDYVSRLFDSPSARLTEGRLYANFIGGKDSLLQIDTPASSVQGYKGERTERAAPNGKG
jgi:hypothetical protein